MPKFRKKPVVIEAWEFPGHMKEPGYASMPEWLRRALAPECPAAHFENETLIIHTLEGDHTASPGDWIIQGVKGELYPCKPDIFAATYEPVE